ncbi:unnamed protein product [Brachionus calyciflorus]|uniref:Uncharacterized protein n=1 Tax=Brachionus calyciflorus TaxID=104777 RepID=A0A813XN82_9BILA|nr:unnamed protein product [Brachionus calyciflorus]
MVFTRFLLILVILVLNGYVHAKAHVREKSLDETNENQNKTKTNVILCDLRNPNKKPCQSDSFYFTFSAVFQADELHLGKNIKTLAKIFSEYAICESMFMKYNNVTQSLEYFSAGDKYLWYPNKKLNSTTSPEVNIVKDSDPRTKRIVFKCPLPKSDVFLSIYGHNFKQAHSHPSLANKVTVSGLHLRLSFLQMESLNVKVNKKRDELYSILDYTKDISNAFKEIIPKQSTERFFVYYDSKCRDCKIDYSIQKFIPYYSNYLNCNLKVNTCEYTGECLNNKEIYSPLKFELEDEKPKLNSFVCLSNFSQTSLYMPCAVRNGNCSYDQKCLFDARTLELKCE